MNNNTASVGGVKKVLIVDDDARNIFALTAVLKARGYNTLSASSAIDGIDKMQADKGISILLLDMMMPDMDGYAALEHIRNLPGAAASIPVIAVTAQAMSGDREKCLAAGANDYISKPIDTTLLVKILDKYLH